MQDAGNQGEHQNIHEAGHGASGRIIVGVGASAGGLEAFQRFLKHMPPHARFALVYVQHLDPHHASVLRELLARDAQMPVHTVHDETPVAPGNIYVIPPNTSLTLQGGVLRLGPRLPQPEFGRPIDAFLASLAQDQLERAVGIILSGTGSDGSLGLRAIKERGGMTIAQLPESCAYDSMPRSAIAAGLVDYVLPPEEMPARLLRHASEAEHLGAGELPGGQQTAADDALDRICDILRRRTGHDFGSYKKNTVVRRINRRMDTLRIKSTADYLKRLEEDTHEAGLLFQEMLIGVTEFFRDPEALDVLGQRVLPRILEGRGASDQVRLWVAGCASGEEVYSLAMLLYEQITTRNDAPPRVQIFATDIDEEGIETARRGCYPESIVDHVSADRLERFFTREDGGYRARKELRQMCVFSKHDLLQDAPFPELDLISCRNLLIYLDNRVQGKLIGLFHYALRPGGFLFLGTSENLAGRPDLFEPVEREQRVYRRRDLAIRVPVEFPLSRNSGGLRAHAGSEAKSGAAFEAGPQRNLERAILDEYTPAGLVLRDGGEIVYLFGPTTKYLAPSAGVPSLNALSLVRKDLRPELRRALHEAVRTHEAVSVHCGPDMVHGRAEAINLIVRPFTETGPESGLYLVVFQDVAAVIPKEPGGPAVASEAAIQQLQFELRNSREQLQMTIDELETANQELQSANEELLSMNEELQSANEELQSSREEIQTVNGELESVNRELTHKVEELDTAKSDLESLFEGTQIATIFLDNDLRIKRFTPAATGLFRLRQGDVGRPVSDITARFSNGDMMSEIGDVLRTLQRREVPVSRADDGARYLMRIMPYRTRQNVIDGVVVAFVDITELKRAQEELESANNELERRVAERTADLENANRRKDEFLAMLSHELRNPLSAIASSIRLWREASGKEPRLDHTAEIAQRQVTHVAHLLDDLLDTARITRGQVKLHRRPLDLRGVLMDAVEIASPRAAERKQAIRVSLSSEPLPVEGDPDRLQQVVGNLLNNAVKYTPEGGHISLSAWAVDGQVVVRVTDDGTGIPPELVPHVFDTFIQARCSPDRSQGGLGLGLTLVRHMVELHGGSVEARSAGEGKGSEFVVRLPLSAKEAEDGESAGGSRDEPKVAATTTATVERPVISNAGKRRILLVEDNPDAAELMATVLKMDGHEVVVAHEGPVALQAAAECHPEVVLLDIGLPGMDGFEVARRVRQDPDLAGTMLVALTGYGREEDLQRSREAGFDHHLVKPVDIDALRRLLDRPPRP